MADMSIKYDNPPVVEVVLGLQFSPLPRFTAAHAGIFWERYLPPDYTESTHASIIEDQFERFGDDMQWGPLIDHGVRIFSGSEPDRTQISTTSGDRMVQLQRTRFHLNWRKTNGEYPSYAVLKPEFLKRFAEFRELTVDKALGELAPNLWEVAYVNHLGKGDLWQDVSSWPDVFSGYWSPGTEIVGQELDRLQAEWRLELVPRRGRLYIGIKSARVKATNQDALLLTLTARGPLADLAGAEVGLDLGHDAIVRTFDSMTSGRAHAMWARRD